MDRGWTIEPFFQVTKLDAAAITSRTSFVEVLQHAMELQSVNLQVLAARIALSVSAELSVYITGPVGKNICKVENDAPDVMHQLRNTVRHS